MGSTTAPMGSAAPIQCDIFCRVVDNFGDIGVTWRLARQLSGEFGVQIRLIVDELASFQKLAPAIDLNAATQTADGIAILAWHQNILLAPAQCVIEAFQCELPTSYINAMALMKPAPVWLNLEYLSAESWVGEHHLLPSPQPQTGLNKYFFFPGFRANTGGLIREHALLFQHQQFQQDQSQATTGSLKIFLFGYENVALTALLESFSDAARHLICTIPSGALARQAKAYVPNVELNTIEFLPQPELDHLLWSHDVLFVRGEDSFVRAQWAAKPFVWQIYPQAERAHWLKLNAFLDLYCEGLAADAADAVRELHRAWNDQDADAIGAAWQAFYGQLGLLQEHAAAWSQKLSQMPDLATQLMTFYAKTAKI